jgi:DNA-binding response OmpR family regulator
MEAISMFIEKNPSFILMDLRMPMMNGMEATQAIRALPQGGKVPIIALTASALKEKKDMTLAAGMNDFMTKPITGHKMEEFLQKLLPSKEITTPSNNANRSESFDFSEEKLLDSLDGDKELMFGLMQSARNYLLEIPLKVELALVKEEREELRELAHKLKGMTQNLGFTQLAKVCKYLEDHYNDSFKELRSEINYLRKATDFYLDLIESKYTPDLQKDV